jgi:hypothetical protein
MSKGESKISPLREKLAAVYIFALIPVFQLKGKELADEDRPL